MLLALAALGPRPLCFRLGVLQMTTNPRPVSESPHFRGLMVAIQPGCVILTWDHKYADSPLAFRYEQTASQRLHGSRAPDKSAAGWKLQAQYPGVGYNKEAATVRLSTVEWGTREEGIEQVELDIAGKLPKCTSWYIGQELRISFWVILSLAAIPHAAWTLGWPRRHRQRERRRRGCCLKCDYDLRGSGDRCPECGTARASAAAQIPGAAPRRLGDGFPWRRRA
jgi:hypothetical protein